MVHVNVIKVPWIFFFSSRVAPGLYNAELYIMINVFFFLETEHCSAVVYKALRNML